MYFIFSVSTAYAPFKNTGDYPQILFDFQIKEKPSKKF